MQLVDVCVPEDGARQNRTLSTSWNLAYHLAIFVVGLFIHRRYVTPWGPQRYASSVCGLRVCAGMNEKPPRGRL